MDVWVFVTSKGWNKASNQARHAHCTINTRAGMARWWAGAELVPWGDPA